MFVIETAFNALQMVTSLIGIFVLFHIFRRQKAPADTSNRINKIKLFWFAMTREDYIAQFAPWMQNDEMDNIKSGKK